jgi:hypothetical protein
MTKQFYKQAFSLSLILSFTLGLAPFDPEPHIWGKLKWLIGGAHGMKPMDWFDLVLHGLPWVAVLYFGLDLLVLKSRVKSKD